MNERLIALVAKLKVMSEAIKQWAESTNSEKLEAELIKISQNFDQAIETLLKENQDD